LKISKKGLESRERGEEPVSDAKAVLRTACDWTLPFGKKAVQLKVAFKLLYL